MNRTPLDWGEEVAAFLHEMDTAYGLLENEDARRRAASVAVIGIIERLNRRSETKGLGALSVVRGMIDFLQDLHHGRDHPWRSLGPFGGAQQQTQEERMLHAAALIAMEMLIDAYGGKHGTKAKAYNFVSRQMAATANPMAVSSLRGLHRKYLQGEVGCSREVDMVLAEQWRAGPTAPSPILCPHGNPIHHCQATKGGRCPQIVKTTEFYVSGMFDGEMFFQTA